MRVPGIFSSLLILLLASSNLVAQYDSIPRPTSDIGLFPRKEPGGLRQLQISGFYRFFATYQRQYDPYLLNPVIGDTALPRNLFIGDDSQLPNLLINAGGKTSDKTSWGFDLMMFQFLDGMISPAYGGQVADADRPPLDRPLLGARLGGNLGLNLGINLYGNFETSLGQISVRAGGIQWFAMSDLTMAAWKGYNRFILYERNPWDPVGRGLDGRYNEYFEQGSISQDARWGNRAFDGVIIEGKQLPGRLSFAVLGGKTELNGGFSRTPNFSYGAKVKKEFGDHSFISLNTFNGLASADSLSIQSYGFNMVTAEFSFQHDGFRLQGELGAGKYFSPIHHSRWGEAMQFKLATPEMKGKSQIELHYFRISPDVVNNTAVFWNTSTYEFRTNDLPAGSIGSSAVLQPFSSSMVRLGQMTNNRQGLNLNVQAGSRSVRFSGGLGTSSELTPAAPVITYSNPVNQVIRSRFWRWVFPANVGPYQRYSDIYRDIFQTVQLSDDSSGIVIHRKHFNMMEAQVKYHTTVKGKDLYLFTLVQANSSSRDWSPVTIFNEKAYIRQYVIESELYIAITPSILLNAYYGYERTLGNYLTDIDEYTRRPRNQAGEGVGCGADVDLGRNARLYLRHRWYFFRDHSFELDRFRGREISVELKAFF